MPKALRNALISAAVLLVLIVGGGIAYIYYTGQDTSLDTAAIATPVEATPPPVMTPTPTAQNAKVSASVQMLTSPIVPGSNTSITVRTNPESTCTISVMYNNIASTDSGLIPKIADEYGMVDWTWTVEKTVPLGKWPVGVTCKKGSQSAYVRGDLVVAKSL